MGGWGEEGTTLCGQVTGWPSGVCGVVRDTAGALIKEEVVDGI